MIFILYKYAVVSPPTQDPTHKTNKSSKCWLALMLHSNALMLQSGLLVQNKTQGLAPMQLSLLLMHDTNEHVCVQNAVH